MSYQFDEILLTSIVPQIFVLDWIWTWSMIILMLMIRICFPPPGLQPLTFSCNSSNNEFTILMTTKLFLQMRKGNFNFINMQCKIKLTLKDKIWKWRWLTLDTWLEVDCSTWPISCVHQLADLFSDDLFIDSFTVFWIGNSSIIIKTDLR